MCAASQKYQKPKHTEHRVSTSTTARDVARRAAMIAKGSNKYGTNANGYDHNQAVIAIPSVTSNQEQIVRVLAISANTA